MANTQPTPQGVVPSDEAVKIFGNILKSAYSEVYSTLQNEDVTDRARRVAILKQIKEVAEQADADVQAWIQTQVPAFYEAGMFETTKGLHERGSEINLTSSFAHFHTEAIDAISKETYASIADGMLGITRTAEQLVTQGQRQAILEGIGKGIITGDTRKEVSKDIVSKLRESGITAMRDKGGKEWDLIRYGEMLARTKLTQAHNTAVANRLVETGYDLVIVSNHRGACKLCAPHEGKVYSVRGGSKLYPALDWAISDGLFHPNCRHQISPYHSAYLDNSIIWDSDEQKYVPYSNYKLKNNPAKPPSDTKVTKSTDWQNIPNDEKQSVVERRINAMTDDPEARKTLLSIVKTGYNPDDTAPAAGLQEYASYLTSNTVIYNEARAQFKADPEGFKKQSPEMYKLLTTKVKK